MNRIRGEFTTHEAEEMCNMLVTLGKAIPAEQWVHGLLKRRRQEGTLASLGKFF